MRNDYLMIIKGVQMYTRRYFSANAIKSFTFITSAYHLHVLVSPPHITRISANVICWNQCNCFSLLPQIGNLKVYISVVKTAKLGSSRFVCKDLSPDETALGIEM